MKKTLFLVLHFIGLSHFAFAQINVENGAHFFAAHGTAVPILFKSEGGPVYWGIVEANAPFEFDTNIAASEMTITFVPRPGMIGTTNWTIGIKDNLGDTNYDFTASIQASIIPQDPLGNASIDVVFVLDVSGSMNDPAVCENGTWNGQDFKITYLKRELRAAFDQIKPYMQVDPSNRLGVVTFSSTADSLLGLISFNTQRATDRMHEILGGGSNSIRAGGATSLGAGILKAIEVLNASPSPNSQKYILVFTNGIQNTPPMVDANGPQILVNNISLTLPPKTFIIPYAIFSPNDAYENLLKKIAAYNNFSSNTSAQNVLKASPFICRVNEALRQNWISAAAVIGSPKIIDYRSNKLSGTTGTELIKVSESMDRLSIEVNSSTTLNINGLTVEKNVGGSFVPITSFGSIYPPEGDPSPHRIFSVLFTSGIPGGAVSAGEYRVNFNSSVANINYQVVSIVDDRGLKQHFFASPIIAAGESMYLGTRLRQAGTPVINAAVSAIIYEPIKALGKSFARKRVPGQFIKTRGAWGRPFWPGFRDDFGSKLFYSKGDAYIKKIEITHPTLPSFQDFAENSRRENGEKKHVVLLHETNYLEAYQQKVVATIPLLHVGDGIYMNKYRNTPKTGLYHVRFEAQGTHPVIGPYKRFEETTPLVIFGTPDRKRSTLCLVYENPLVLLIRPVDIHGNLLGPNQVDAINIEMSAGSSSNLVDYLDGRYMVRLFVPDGVDPEISIRINGRTLYDGLLSKICRQRWFFQVAAGKPNAAQNLELNYDGHWFAEASLGYRLNWSWALQAKGGFYQFKGIQTANTHVVGLNMGLAYRTWTNYFGGLYLSPELNAGFYQRKGADWKFGYNYGLGLHRQLSHRLDLVIQYGQHAFDQGAAQERFSTLGAGLRLKF